MCLDFTVKLKYQLDTINNETYLIFINYNIILMSDRKQYNYSYTKSIYS